MKKTLRVIAVIAIILTIGTSMAQDDFKTPQELADPDGKFVMIDDVEIYYIAQGPEDGPVVILIHGFGGSTFTWRDNISVLADAGFYTIALDLPPFGLSDKNPGLDYTRSWMSDLVAGLMDELGIESATLLGHSMGGSVVAYFAVQHPQRVDKLVFVAGGIGYQMTENDQGSESNSQSESPLSLLGQIDPESPLAGPTLRLMLTPEVFTEILLSAYYRKEVVTDEVAEGYQRPLLTEDWPLGLLNFASAEELNPLTLDDLAESIIWPVLIIWGEQDPWVSIVMGEAMRDSLPNVTWITYPQAGHLPMEENTTQFNQDLLASSLDK